MLHQVTVATDDVQGIDNRLPGLICEEDDEDSNDNNCVDKGGKTEEI